MAIERVIMNYSGNTRKKGWRTLPPIELTATVRCAAGDWLGEVSDADKNEGEYRCPSCGNYIFGGFLHGEDYSYRLKDMK